MKKILFILILVTSVTFAQTSRPTIHSIMRTEVAPNADALFALQGKKSISNAEWNEVIQKTLSLHATAHKLKSLNTEPEWQQHADAIDALSERAVVHSMNKNLRGLTDTSDKMFNVCYSCHSQFFPKGKNL